MPKCMDCQRYYNLVVNSKRERKHQDYSPRLGITEDEFVAWCRSTARNCAFCGLPESDLPGIGLVSTIGRPVAALGIDRISNADDYRIGNIQFCCFACNKAKGNVFTDAETRELIGPRIGDCWAVRAGGTADPHPRPAFVAGEGRPVGSCSTCGLDGVQMDTARRCTACTKYRSLEANSRKQRKLRATPGLSVTITEFSAWYRDLEYDCAYCGIPEEHLLRTGVLTQVGHPLKNLGIDRVDNDRGYEPDNLALCCYACNKVKGDVFTDTEMSNLVGPAIGAVWVRRGIPSLDN